MSIGLKIYSFFNSISFSILFFSYKNSSWVRHWIDFIMIEESEILSYALCTLVLLYVSSRTLFSFR